MSYRQEKATKTLILFKYLQVPSRFGLDRNAVLIALGASVGDITGCCSYFSSRNNYVQIPTSLLAQSDSSVGSKVGVDFEGSKNIIEHFINRGLCILM